MIAQSDIHKFNGLPIEEVAEQLGLKIKKHQSLCPFHDDKRPSLHFNIAKNSYRCYACGAHGRTIDLVMNYHHLSFLDACQWLSNRTNVILPNSRLSSLSNLNYNVPIPSTILAQLVAQPALTEEARTFLFDERHLDPRVIKWCGISSTHSDILIPYFDINGRFLSIQWRSLHPNPKSINIPRFRFPRGNACTIYNLQIVKTLKKGEPLFICEGPSDCWSMLSSGHKAIAIPSATLLKPDDLKPLETCSMKLGTTFHMYPDADEPGEKLFSDLKHLLNSVSTITPITLIRHQLPSGCKDFSDYYMKRINVEIISS